MQSQFVGCPRADEPDACRRFHDVLVGHGYTVDGLLDTIQLSGGSTLEPKNQAAILHRTPGGSPLDTLIRLFILGVDADVAAVRAAAAPMTPQEWAASPLLRKVRFFRLDGASRIH